MRTYTIHYAPIELDLENENIQEIKLYGRREIDSFLLMCAIPDKDEKKVFLLHEDSMNETIISSSIFMYEFAKVMLRYKNCKIFYLFEFKTWEDAYDVALLLKDGVDKLTRI